MNHWLVKTEADEWGWQHQTGVATAPWTGVRNFQAQKHMRAMQTDDLVLFYHTGKERSIVGLCSVSRAAYPDPDDPTGRFCLVDLKAERPVKTPLSLSEIKARENLVHLALVKQSRLSVMPIDAVAFEEIASLTRL